MPRPGPGEREALSLATQTPGSLLVIDDALARRHARLLGLSFTGTLGVLLRAKVEGHLPAIASILQELEDRGFRLDPMTRAHVLRLAGEAP